MPPHEGMRAAAWGVGALARPELGERGWPAFRPALKVVGWCSWEEGLGSGTAKLVPPSDSTRIHFHPWCISGPGGDTGVEGAQLSETDSRLQLEFKSFDDVRHELGHSTRKVDVLKIDIEGAEWKVLENLLGRPATTVASQLLIEMHFGTGCWTEPFHCRSMPKAKVTEIALQYARAGWGMFAMNRNPMCPFCLELGFGALSSNATNGFVASGDMGGATQGRGMSRGARAQ